MSQSIEGPLMNWSDQDWCDATKWTTRKDGTKFESGSELKREYLRVHRDGWRVVPYGDCDNFDKEKGCQGHEIESVS
jgi:hypothetical protein